jgi:hypothetical protein
MGTVRSRAEVSAKRVKEHAKKTIARASNLAPEEGNERVWAARRCMRESWGGRRKKPIALGVRKFCYRGPGTGFLAPEGVEKEVVAQKDWETVPNRFRSAQLGLAAEASSGTKVKIMSSLVGVCGDFQVGVGRAIEGDVDAFQMTRCEEKQARGKGLACYFLQIVSTCL